MTSRFRDALRRRSKGTYSWPPEDEFQAAAAPPPFPILPPRKSKQAAGPREDTVAVLGLSPAPGVVGSTIGGVVSSSPGPGVGPTMGGGMTEQEATDLPGVTARRRNLSVSKSGRCKNRTGQRTSIITLAFEGDMEAIAGASDGKTEQHGMSVEPQKQQQQHLQQQQQHLQQQQSLQQQQRQQLQQLQRQQQPVIMSQKQPQQLQQPLQQKRQQLQQQLQQPVRSQQQDRVNQQQLKQPQKQPQQPQLQPSLQPQQQQHLRGTSKEEANGDLRAQSHKKSDSVGSGGEPVELFLDRTPVNSVERRRYHKDIDEHITACFDIFNNVVNVPSPDHNISAPSRIKPPKNIELEHSTDL